MNTISSEVSIVVIEAKYENGVFRPLGEVKLKEGTVVEVHVNGIGSRVKSIRELDFAGMWAERTDIGDGVTYVDRLRDSPRA
jgi:predicted DNA-binding antitoxin AbrB/MazE fold protein